MSKPGKAPVNHGLVPVDLNTAKESLPQQTVMKIFSISIIAQGLPFCRRRVSLSHLKSKNVYLMLVCFSPSEAVPQISMCICEEGQRAQCSQGKPTQH